MARTLLADGAARSRPCRRPSNGMSSAARVGMQPARSRSKPDPRWTRNEAVFWRQVRDAVVILPARADTPLVVRRFGALLWDLLAAPIPLSELARVLSDLTDATEAAVARDLEPLLVQLSELGVVDQVARER